MNIIKYSLGIFLYLVCIQSSAQLYKPIELKCEYLEQPLGIDAARPRFSWLLNDPRNGAIQTAYQIMVASDSILLLSNQPDVWTTSRLDSRSTNNILYTGPTLQSRTKYYWWVVVWDKDNIQSSPSSISSFETGIFSLTEWKGSFITDRKDIQYKPAPYFRKSIIVKNGLKKARAYICGLGYYELSINATKVGDHFLDPGYTRFDKTALYVTYDVTDYLKSNQNTLGVILGNGWYNDQSASEWDFDKAPWRGRPKFILNLYLEYEDGTTELIVTDDTWKTSDSPVISNNIYSGEVIDARLEKQGWDISGYEDSAWKNAKNTSPPAGRLTAQKMPAIKLLDVIKPITRNQIDATTIVFDLGQNIAGISHLKVKGMKGTVVYVRHGERLDTLGRLKNEHIDKYYTPTDSLQLNQRDVYILKGDGVEEFSIRFSYHGFRYVEVKSNNPVSIVDLYGQVAHTDLENIGSFECSNQTLNKIWKATNWSYLSNMHSIPTDCPHREKNGWTGDAHVACEFGLLNYDGILFYENWIREFANEQRLSGELPGIIPTSGWGYAWGNGPTYDAAIILIPWYVYLYYGDDSLIKLYYENYKRYVDYLRFRSKNNLVNFGLGDWNHWETETPVEFMASSYYYVCANLLSVFASLNEKKEDELLYANLAIEIKDAINAKYLDKEKYQYANGSQAALSTALYWGIVPAEIKGDIANSLIKAIEKSENHLDVGLLGSKTLLDAAGKKDAEVAYKVAAQETKPSWGWWFKNGATTLHEDWESGSSLNHIMFGEVSAWMVKCLAGLNPDSSAVGFRNIIIKPHFVKDLSFVKASFQSVNGLIKSEWERKGGKIILNLLIPANSTATLYLPITETKNDKSIKLIDKKSKQTFTSLKQEENYSVYNIGAGEYRFEIK